MDRELTDDEKVENKKKFGDTSRGHSSDRISISYQFVITWSVFAAFLILPSVVDYTIETLASIIYIDKPIERAPHTEQDDGPALRVYAARTWGPKGMFAVHSWIAMKRRGSENFEVIQVIGWRQGPGGNVLFRETNVPIDSWWGNEATLILDLQGDDIEAVIDKVDAAILEYPWKREYTLYPGPNSNTFVAWIGLQVPEMGLDLPSTAIGKDWRPLEHSLGSSASGTGLQASLLGLLGTSIGLEEGLEINIFGLSFEMDVFDLALEIPLFGRYEVWYLLCYLVIWLSVRKSIHRAKSKYFHLV